MQRIAYLTYRERARDLDSRLLVAASILDRGGTQVVVLPEAVMQANLRSLPDGAVWSSTPYLPALIADYRKAGHAVVLSDEDALAHPEPETILEGLAPGALAECTTFLCQSPRHRDAIGLTNYALVDKCVVVGNPRCQLFTGTGLRIHGRDADTIKRANAPYVLLRPRAEMGEPQIRQWEQVIHDLLRISTHKIILLDDALSPAGRWKNWAHKLSRVLVIERGGLETPFILGAAQIVTDDPETALYSLMAGKHCIQMGPTRPVFFCDDEIGWWAKDADGVARMLDYTDKAEPIPFDVIDNWLSDDLPMWASHVAFAVGDIITHELRWGLPCGADWHGIKVQGGGGEFASTVDLLSRIRQIADEFSLATDVNVQAHELGSGALAMVRQ